MSGHYHAIYNPQHRELEDITVLTHHILLNHYYVMGKRCKCKYSDVKSMKNSLSVESAFTSQIILLLYP